MYEPQKQQGMHLTLIIALFAVSLLPACSASDELPRLKTEVLASHKLDNMLNETSGLVCTAQTAVTTNDSGNDAALFEVNDSGDIVRQHALDFANKDFEAVTADEDYFYIGDVGNNKGHRPYVSIRKVDRKTFQKVKTLRLTYTDNSPKTNIPYAHDYDAESLVNRTDHLILFSKSWASQQARVYRIEKDAKDQTLTAIGTVKGLPGVVTGADWDAANHRYVLVGYKSSAIGLFKPFIATVSPDWHVQGMAMLEGFGQVEGICVRNASEVLITQESSPLNTARIARLAIE